MNWKWASSGTGMRGSGFFSTVPTKRFCSQISEFFSCWLSASIVSARGPYILVYSSRILLENQCCGSVILWRDISIEHFCREIVNFCQFFRVRLLQIHFASGAALIRNDFFRIGNLLRVSDPTGFGSKILPAMYQLTIHRQLAPSIFCFLWPSFWYRVPVIQCRVCFSYLFCYIFFWQNQVNKGFCSYFASQKAVEPLLPPFWSLIFNLLFPVAYSTLVYEYDFHL
jgi:hypothetical protein